MYFFVTATAYQINLSFLKPIPRIQQASRSEGIGIDGTLENPLSET